MNMYQISRFQGLALYLLPNSLMRYLLYNSPSECSFLGWEENNWEVILNNVEHQKYKPMDFIC